MLAAHVQLCNASVLSLAVRDGHKATAAMLIEAGANVNARDEVRAVRVCMLLWLTNGTVLARRMVTHHCM